MDKVFFRVFRAGKYPQGTFSENDVREIAESYNPQYHEAPLTVNHDDWSPALAVVDEVKVEGKDLLVSFKDILDEAYEMNKKYKRPSVEIVDYDFGDQTKKYLRAVTLTNFPQVKSMDKIQFGENSVFLFMEDLTLNLNKGKKMFNEKLIALAQKLGLESINNEMTEDEVILKCTEAAEALQSTNQSISQSLSKFTEAGISVETYQEKLANWDKENAKVVALEAEVKKFKEEGLTTLINNAIATKDVLTSFGSTEAFEKHVKKFAEHSEFSEVKSFVDGMKAKTSNLHLKGPEELGDKKFFKEDGKAITYEDILRDPSLAAKFSEAERLELKKKSENFSR